MTADDHAALVALGKQMAATNGYTAMQSSSLYVTDGDEIDWAYGLEHIFMYTFEMYPSHSKVSSTARFYPADELIAPQTERNKAADPLCSSSAAGCPYGLIGKATDELRAAVRRLRDVRWLGPQPARHRHGDGRRLAARRPGADRAPGRDRPVGLAGAGHRRPGGRDANTYDVDGGVTTIRSAPVALPGQRRLADLPLLLRPQLELVGRGLLPRLRRGRDDGIRTLVSQELGAANNDLPIWATAHVSMAPWAGETVRIVFEAADLGRASTVEAAVDDVRITRP